MLPFFIFRFLKLRGTISLFFFFFKSTSILTKSMHLDEFSLNVTLFVEAAEYFKLKRIYFYSCRRKKFPDGVVDQKWRNLSWFRPTKEISRRQEIALIILHSTRVQCLVGESWIFEFPCEIAFELASVGHSHIIFHVSVNW